MNQFKTIALLALLTGLLVVIGEAIGGRRGMLLGLILAAIINIGSWYFSDRIALAIFHARPAIRDQEPVLYRIVDRLCERGNLPFPAIYIIPTLAANAFATGRDPEHAAIGVTEGILELLPEDELEAVIAHELSHIRERDTLTQAVAATIAGAISFLVRLTNFSLWFSGGFRNRGGKNPLGLLVTVILAPIAASILQMAISRTREFEADAGSARLTGNPSALARALTRLENLGCQTLLNANPAFGALLIINPFSERFLMDLFSTHPSTEARIENLRQIEAELLESPRSI